jgi:hypothetical protein
MAVPVTLLVGGFSFGSMIVIGMRRWISWIHVVPSGNRCLAMRVTMVVCPRVCGFARFFVLGGGIYNVRRSPLKDIAEEDISA